MPPAIRVENLGKSFRIGHEGRRVGYRTLRESLVSAPAAMMRRVRNGVGGGRSEEFWALKDVNLEVLPGEIVGIIGHNGAGKSTLLKILSRITKPTVGQIEIRGRVGSLLEVGTGFHPELTGRENIFLNGSILGMSRREIAGRFDEIVTFAEVERFLDTPVKRYSSGMYVRLAFAVAAHLEPEILLVDEVLAVGDAHFQKKCLEKMEGIARGGRTILLVSHQMSLVQRLSHRAALLEGGRTTAFGATGDVIEQYLSRGPEEASPRHWIDLSRASRRGTGGARFLAARYCCPEGNTSGRPYPDGPLEVQFAIESESVRCIDSLGLRFFDHYGTLLINANLMFLGESIPLRRGRNEISLNIQQLHLNPGVYTTDLKMGISSTGEPTDYVSPAFRMDVIDAADADPIAVASTHPRGKGLVTCRYHFST
ncbi:MAG: polysaccharide ABC transporter ATP-binding protein [Isosphaeraceae bacterium]